MAYPDETTDPMAGLRSIFYAGDMNDPRVNQALRQRIALQLMTQGKKGYPKTLGEGLSAIGDAIGDRGLANMLAQSDIATQEGDKGAAERIDRPAETTRDIYQRSDALGGGDQPAVVPEGAKDAPARSIDVASLPPPAAEMPPPPPAAAVLAAPRMQPGQLTTNVDMPQQNTILKDPAAVIGRDAGTVPPTALSVAQGYMDPAGASSLGVGSVNQAMEQPDATALARPPDALLQRGRAQLAQALLARQQSMQPTAPVVPQPNPTLPGAGVPQLPPSSTIPSPEGSRPDLRLAQDTSRSVSDISAAPQVPQIRSAPPPQAIPGYVTPIPGAASAPPLVPLSPRGQAALRELQNNPNLQTIPNGRVMSIYAMEADRQKQEQAQVNEAYKKRLDINAELEKKHYENLADQAKRIAEEAHIRQQAAIGALIDPNEKQYVLGPDGVARPLKVEGQDPRAMPQVKLTEPQQKALVFHDWARLGNEGIQGNEQLLAKGLQQELLGKVPFAGNSLQSAEYRRVRNNANNFVLAFMRDTSGAAYGAKEMYDHASALLPKFGDDAGTLADKAKQRDAFVNNMYGSLGPGRQIADYNVRQQKEKEQIRQQAIDTEMQGVVPKGIGDTKTNIKTGVKRVWNGKNWLEM